MTTNENLVLNLPYNEIYDRIVMLKKGAYGWFSHGCKGHLGCVAENRLTAPKLKSSDTDCQRCQKTEPKAENRCQNLVS